MSVWMCQSCHSLQGFSKSMKCFACEGPLAFATVNTEPPAARADGPAPLYEGFGLDLQEDAEQLFANLCEGNGKHSEALDVKLIIGAFRRLLGWAAQPQLTAALAEVATLTQELAHWKICSLCGQPMDAPGFCAEGTNERIAGLEAMHEQTMQRAEQAEAEVATLHQAHQWQPIETAPKDGTRVDLWAKAWLPAFDRFEFHRFADCWWWKGDSMTNGSPKWMELSKDWHPTHWRPKPDGPPESACK